MFKPTPDMAAPPPGLGLLMWVRCCDLRNRASQALREAPLRVVSTIVFVALIWTCLYLFFRTIFDQMQSRLVIESAVAIPLIFHFFFIALTVMLIFSNAVLVHGALFGREEAGYLYSLPIAPRHVVLMKFLEALLFSSWSLILLGLPLMLALARVLEKPGPFYVLFIGLFVSFVPIPGAIGLLAAWAAGMWFPRTARRVMFALGFVVGAGAFVWFVHTWRSVSTTSPEWLNSFLSRMSLVKSILLPSTWVTRGIDYAVHGQMQDAAFYLLVTAANALFVCWLAVVVVAPSALKAFGRVHSSSSPARNGSARTGRGRWRAWRSSVAAAMGRVAFFYLPDPMRRIVLKDVRSFVRDPMQWSQLAILFGLMALYIINVPQVNPEFQSWRTQRLISFLNLAAVSLILATFTSRFVFPLVSLEGQQMWLIGLLPLSRRRVLWAKFAFALAVTLGCALLVMVLAAITLELPWPLAAVQMAVTASACVALCGLSVGIGALLPVFNQRNPSRIASGFGGTVNLLLSVAYVGIMLAAMCWLTLFHIRSGTGEEPVGILGNWPEAPDFRALGVIVAVILFSLSTAAVALHAGRKKFEHSEL
jgi:ABC-2 type transport system permease protein